MQGTSKGEPRNIHQPIVLLHYEERKNAAEEGYLLLGWEQRHAAEGFELAELPSSVERFTLLSTLRKLDTLMQNSRGIALEELPKKDERGSRYAQSGTKLVWRSEAG